MSKHKNILLITVDALSKFYIDRAKNKNGFFDNLEKKSYCINNMYSMAPFTQGALKAYWSGEDTIEGYSYLSETSCLKNSIFNQYQEKGYFLYIGRLVPFFCDRFPFDFNNDDNNPAVRGFDHLWRGRLNYFLNIFDKGQLKKTDLWKIEYILTDFFASYKYFDVEYRKFMEDKEKYIYEILEKKEKSSLYLYADDSLYKLCKNKNLTNVSTILKKDILKEEAAFAVKSKYKNIAIFIEKNKGFVSKERLDKELVNSSNRCLQSNDDLITQLRDSYEHLPKLKDEVDEFLEWYDNKDIKQPFFAYIHNYDFHFPENFLNSSYDNKKEYIEEIIERENELDELYDNGISVSKQLCLRNIERVLNYFWKELKKRKIFDDTYVVLTADHGISNFMNIVDYDSDRWNYTKVNFQIPFYVQGANTIAEVNNNFYSAKDIYQWLSLSCDFKVFERNKKDFSYAYWINGVPDLDRNFIQLGIRNNEFSITYRGFLTQLFHEKNIVGVYNLKKDRDECRNLGCIDFSDTNLKKQILRLKDIWNNLIWNILSNKSGNYGYDLKYGDFIDNKGFFESVYERFQMEKWTEIKEKLSRRKVILYGAGVRAFELLNNSLFDLEINEMWDSTGDVKKYRYGCKVSIPHALENPSDYFIIITSRYEIEMIWKLKQLRIQEYMLSDLIIWDGK